MTQVPSNTASNDPGKPRARANRHVLRWLLPLVIVGAGAIGGQILLGSGPQARMAPPAPQPRLVETATFEPATDTPEFEAMGTVIAAHTSTLYPRVSGPVVAVSDQLMPGGHFKSDEQILRIDATDYQLTLRKQQAAAAAAKAALQEELGQQAIAKREYELLDRKLGAADKALVLRQPQLASARATLDSASADRDQAKLQLERTQVSAPFDGMVVSRNVDLGTQVTTGTALLTLINVDTFWVEVSVPVAHLARIAIPTDNGQTGARVELYQTALEGAQSRLGHVLRLIPELDGDSRMARLLVEIPDPLALREENAGLPPIMVNDYLRVRIVGEPINDIVTLPRRLLRDGDNVWLVAADDTLEIRHVDVVHRGNETVFVKAGIQRNDRIITVDMTTPVAGTPLRVRPAGVAPDSASQVAAGKRAPGTETGS